MLSRDHPLAGCEQKLRRAFQHFIALQNELTVFESGNIKLATFRGELKPDAESTMSVVVKHVSEPPLHLATIIGDFIHNVRSTLDHLVFELAFLGLRGQQSPRRTAFPASRTRDNWRSVYVQRVLLNGVMQKHRVMLYRAQPCYGLKDAPTDPRTIRRRKRHPAADLQDLWNEDKHRLLQPVLATPYRIKPRFSGFRDCVPSGKPRVSRDFLGRPLKVDTEVLTLPLGMTGPHPRVDVEIEIACTVGFGNGVPVLTALADIGDWVARVVERFEPVFETPSAKSLWGLPRGGWVESEPAIADEWVERWEVVDGRASPSWET